MSSFLRRNAGLVTVAVLSLSVGLAAPAVSHGVNHALFAHNADKVDSKHAVGAGASVANRKGKLVATGSTGRLPDNIIAKAPDANKVDGIDSRQLQFPNQVPAGTTVVGRWGIDGDGDGGGDWGAPISYPAPLSGTHVVEVVQYLAPSTATCPGTAAAPTAAPGRVCVYVENRAGGSPNVVPHGVSRFGMTLLLIDDGTPGDILAWGTWAAKPAAANARVAPRGTAEATK